MSSTNKYSLNYVLYGIANMFSRSYICAKDNSENTDTPKTMEQLKLDANKKKPAINFDADKGLIEIKGRSMPENVSGFYQPLIKWIDGYMEAPNSKTTVNIELEYFNTASAFFVLEMLKRIVSIATNNKSNLEINWLYKKYDTDIEDAGRDYAGILKFPINMVVTNADEDE